jgi:hypothetical protein
MAAVLGEQMKILVVAVKGEVNEESGQELVKELVEKIGMTIAPEQLLCRYPVDGKGGFGYTFFQPLTESFIAFDSWPDLCGGYLVICSCGSLPLSRTLKVIEEHGLECKHFRQMKLSIKDYD